RFELALRLNNLLASPGFSGWMEGEPLDIGKLLYTRDGKPRLSVISIAHLSEAERMFFVSILLNEMLAWTRTQSGTSSLRAILYMDEIFGYFPPSANPPSKTPMLTLLKQARAVGVGIVLATQNPVDLDYKGLSNAGTWFLGRLQTERDQVRVLDGLEGASAAAGARFDRQRAAATLSALGSRVFLMNNVHEDEPVVFQTRWTLSYLRGPLTRDQIKLLMDERRAVFQPPTPATETAQQGAPSRTLDARPLLPPGTPEAFWPVQIEAPGSRIAYRPYLFGAGRLHYVEAKAGIDRWQAIIALAPAEPANGSIWDQANLLQQADAAAELESQPEPGAGFYPLPAEFSQAKNYAAWSKTLKDHLYRNVTLNLWKCIALKESSRAEESKGDFLARLAHAAREDRDAQVEKLQAAYASKLATLKERIRKAEQRVDREKSQSTQQTLQAAISFGASVLGALLGRKLASTANMNRAASAMRAAGRAAREHGDIKQAEDSVEALQQRLTQLEAEFQAEVDRIEAAVKPDALTLEPWTIRAKKSEIAIERVTLVWMPWNVDAANQATPAFDEIRP
ncbi:MAG TPA: ATP-binding protein, partial [Pirellulales bacterium]|nr:ATP-binding protein [Pirellulales bacterium]